MNRVLKRGQPIPETSCTVLLAIEELASSLRLAGITDPRRVATDIIAALLEVPRSWPVMNREESLDASVVASARNAANKLAKGAPFAYAVGKAAFRHLNLSVDERVLIPRAETEVLVGEIIERLEAAEPHRETWGLAVDIGTGSGAIALSLAAEGRFDQVIGTDASLDALDVARANADMAADALRSKVDFRHGSLLTPVKGLKATVLVSNPPYIAYSEADVLPGSVRDWEPPFALFSGREGMSATEGIVRDGAQHLVSGGLLALEVDERRASLVAELIMRQGSYANVGVRLDLTGRERFVFATRN